MAKTSAPSEDETKRELPWERKRSCSCYRSDSVMITLPKCFRQAFNFLIAFAKHESFQYRRVNGRNNSLRHLYIVFFCRLRTMTWSRRSSRADPPETALPLRATRPFARTVSWARLYSSHQFSLSKRMRLQGQDLLSGSAKLSKKSI